MNPRENGMAGWSARRPWYVVWVMTCLAATLFGLVWASLP